MFAERIYKGFVRKDRHVGSCHISCCPMQNKLEYRGNAVGLYSSGDIEDASDSWSANEHQCHVQERACPMK